MLRWMIFIGWLAAANVLLYRLRAYRVDQDATEFFGLMKRRVYLLDLFRPSVFHAEGQQLRRITLATLVAGPVLLVTLF